jgi:hypothetical protein
MKWYLFFCCLALVVLGGTAAQADPKSALTSETAAGRSEGYYTFQPSKICKQKRKLKPRFSGWGWGVLAITGLLMVGLAWLAVWLWPMSAIGWRILIVLLGGSFAAVIAFMGFFMFSYAYTTSRDLRFEAQRRLAQLTEKMPYSAEKGWCLSGEYFRLSLGANPASLLIVDYRQDKAWVIPKENIAAIKPDFVEPNFAKATYPSKSGSEVILTKAMQPLPNQKPDAPPGEPEKPLQVLHFELRNLPLDRFTFVYREQIYSDSAQHIAGELRTLWGIN